MNPWVKPPPLHHHLQVSRPRQVHVGYQVAESGVGQGGHKESTGDAHRLAGARVVLFLPYKPRDGDLLVAGRSVQAQGPGNEIRASGRDKNQ